MRNAGKVDACFESGSTHASNLSACMQREYLEACIEFGPKHASRLFGREERAAYSWTAY